MVEICLKKDLRNAANELRYAIYIYNELALLKNKFLDDTFKNRFSTDSFEILFLKQNLLLLHDMNIIVYLTLIIY